MSFLDTCEKHRTVASYFPEVLAGTVTQQACLRVLFRRATAPLGAVALVCSPFARRCYLHLSANEVDDQQQVSAHRVSEPLVGMTVQDRARMEIYTCTAGGVTCSYFLWWRA